MDYENPKINERIKLVREATGLSRKAMGAGINLSGQRFGVLEKAGTVITERVFNNICQKYSVNPDYLLNGTEPMFFSKSQLRQEIDEIFDDMSPAFQEIMVKMFRVLRDETSSKSFNDTGKE